MGLPHGLGAVGHLSYVCFSPWRHAKWSRESAHCLRFPGEFLYNVEEKQYGDKRHAGPDAELFNNTHLGGAVRPCLVVQTCNSLRETTPDEAAY